MAVGSMDRVHRPYCHHLTHQPYRAVYFAVMTKCPRRFCCQQDSFSSLQNGCSLPLLTTVIRPAGTPRLDQVVLHGGRAADAEREVVLGAASRVAVPFDA